MTLAVESDVKTHSFFSFCPGLNVSSPLLIVEERAVPEDSIYIYYSKPISLATFSCASVWIRTCDPKQEG